MHTTRRSVLKLALLGVPLALGSPRALAAPADSAAAERWSQSRAKAWRAGVGWLVGSNYITSTAVNQLDMFGAKTFDPARIATELGWAKKIGMNCVRVFLHDQLWTADPAGFTKRVDRFLGVANNAGLTASLVLLDSCWDPYPKAGTQPDPRPGVHNSRWVQSPGATLLAAPDAEKRLQDYVGGIVSAFARDTRIAFWDLWNEPDNTAAPQYPIAPANRQDRVAQLLPQVFAWARAVSPQQPLTSATWTGSTSRIAQIQNSQSDIITFHSYDAGPKFEATARRLTDLGRPVLCTEYMARALGSTIADILPIANRLGVGAINWGLVAGKTQTYLPWDSWGKPYTNGRVADPWFHDLLHPDGSPYDPDEVSLIQKLSRQTVR